MDENSQDQPTEDQKTLYSVGDEFVAWANKYWGLGDKYDQPTPEGQESVTFEQVKPYFINKINELIEQNLRYGGLIK